MYFGPALIVSVAYMDPGNYGTDISGGASFGYSTQEITSVCVFKWCERRNLNRHFSVCGRRGAHTHTREIHARFAQYCSFVVRGFCSRLSLLRKVLRVFMCSFGARGGCEKSCQY